MFTAKLKDGTEVQVSIEELEAFFKEHGDSLQSQPKKFGKRRSLPITA